MNDSLVIDVALFVALTLGYSSLDELARASGIVVATKLRDGPGGLRFLVRSAGALR